jgi:hypothetical protein
MKRNSGQRVHGPVELHARHAENVAHAFAYQLPGQGLAAGHV